MEQKTKVMAEEGKQDLHITRDFDLPAELVFKAYTDAELLAQWMGTKVLQLDNHPQGGYRFETSYEGKVVFSANGCIHELIENRKIVRTFEMDNTSIGAQLEILNFEPVTQNTSRLSIHIIYQSEAHRAEQLKMPFAYGINRAHDQLQEIVNKAK